MLRFRYHSVTPVKLLLTDKANQTIAADKL